MIYNYKQESWHFLSLFTLYLFKFGRPVAPQGRDNLLSPPVHFIDLASIVSVSLCHIIYLTGLFVCCLFVFSSYIEIYIYIYAYICICCIYTRVSGTLGPFDSPHNMYIHTCHIVSFIMPSASLTLHLKTTNSISGVT